MAEREINKRIKVCVNTEGLIYQWKVKLNFALYKAMGVVDSTKILDKGR